MQEAEGHPKQWQHQASGFRKTRSPPFFVKPGSAFCPLAGLTCQQSRVKVPTPKTVLQRCSAK